MRMTKIRKMFEIYLIISFAITAVLSQSDTSSAPSSSFVTAPDWSQAVLREGNSCAEMARELSSLQKLSRKSVFFIS